MIIKVQDLQNNMMGIYKITFPNNKIYIGLSIDIRRRMWEHNNPSSNKTPCDQAINKYGPIKEIEILEFVNDPAQLGIREQYWIQFFNATDKTIGYNLTIGGDTSQLFGEQNNAAVFTNAQVLDIRKRRFLGERKKDVYKDYQKLSFGTFERVWLGKGYPQVGQEYLIAPHSKTRQEYSSEANDGVKNGRAKCSVEDIIKIRNLYEQGHTYTEIAKQFPSISKSTVRRIALRESYKNVK